MAEDWIRQSPVVTDTIIGVFQQMQDEKRKPKIIEVQKQYGCDKITNDESRVVVGRIKDAVDNGVSISLTTEETKLLFAYMLAVETNHELQRMAARSQHF